MRLMLHIVRKDLRRGRFGFPHSPCKAAAIREAFLGVFFERLADGGFQFWCDQRVELTGRWKRFPNMF